MHTSNTDIHQIYQSGHRLSIALYWYGFGYLVVPIITGEKYTPFKWDPWIAKYSANSIMSHWEQHPDHEVGCIVGDEFIVFDADSPESLAALSLLEKTFDLTPPFVMKTNKGDHHHYRLASGTYAKSDSHSTQEYPDRLDIKTGRALVVLSGPGRSPEVFEVNHANELNTVDQEFIDAVFRHNGRDAPRPVAALPAPPLSKPLPESLRVLEALLAKLSPNLGYEDWLHVLMAIFHETGGSEAGFQLADQWSAKGKSYKGMAEIRSKWHSFGQHRGNPVTIATIHQLLAKQNIDWKEIIAEVEAPFKPCETTVVEETLAALTINILLAKYSLQGHLDEIERSVVNSRPLLGNIALMGQYTVFYAAPNTGKTLVTLYLLMDAISHGRVDPSLVFYLNMDDTSEGLLEKLQIAEEYGFHMIASGHRGFMPSKFMTDLQAMIANDQAQGVVIIMDTLKKCADLMDKRSSSTFNELARQFVVKGGTLIALAHVNKNPGPDNKPIPCGTSDVIDDADCVYTLRVIDQQDGNKIVEFENIKQRGHVAARSSFKYCNRTGISYASMVASVERVDDEICEELKQAASVKADGLIIEAIESCIREGITTKMMLATEAGKRSNVSKADAILILEKYQGDDPTVHHWHYSVQNRGAKVFALLPSESVDGVGV